ncbi:MAG: hypothetical protein LBE08_11135 [Bifidobacteriaceae bacterium]|jgi:hypothetical protein|nr:hypothetical protein [Bifidobacteriaceae bacterium]
MVTCGVLGLFIGLRWGSDAIPSRIGLEAPLIFAGLVVAVVFHVVIHEAGHLLFGRLTGYRFVSIRFGSWVWIKSGGRVRLRRYHLAGMQGQCLMAPPEPLDPKSGQIPFALYNLGGPIVNLAVGGLAGALCFAAPSDSALFLVLAEIAGVGLLLGLLNGIPLRFGLAPNDGQNALEMAGETGEPSRRAFSTTLKMHELAAEGIRLRDMPAEWFAAPPGADAALAASLDVYRCDRLLDMLEFEAAAAQIKQVLESGVALAGLHRLLLTVQSVYCEAVGANRAPVVNQLLTKEVRRFMKSMRRYPAVLRANYALAWLVDKDPVAAARAEKEFERVAAKYPYAGEIASERELIAHAKTLS